MKNNGFSLLEAMVAMVILSSSLMACYAWFSQGINALIKSNDTLVERYIVEDLLQRINLVELAPGSLQKDVIDGYDVEWSSSLLEPTRRGRSATGAPSAYDLSLYNIEFHIRKHDRTVIQGDFREVRYKDLRNEPL